VSLLRVCVRVVCDQLRMAKTVRCIHCIASYTRMDGMERSDDALHCTAMVIIVVIIRGTRNWTGSFVTCEGAIGAIGTIRTIRTTTMMQFEGVWV